MDQPKTVSAFDQYIAQSGGVFVRIDQFQVECTVCGFVFHNSEKRNLENHIKPTNKRHHLFVTNDAIEGLSKDEMFEVFSLLDDFPFLIREKDTGELYCNSCLNAPLPMNRDSIRKHKNSKRHREALLQFNQNCLRGDELPEQVPSAPKRKPSKEDKRAQILKEANREPGVLVPFLVHEHGNVLEETLACAPCARKFDSKDLRNSVYHHLKTDRHQKALVAKKPQPPVVVPGYEPSRLNVRPEREIPVTRKVPDSIAADAAKLCLELNMPFRLADKEYRKHLIQELQHPVSTYVIRTRGADLLHNRIMEARCKYLRDKQICIMVDETTVDKHIICGLVIFSLEPNMTMYKFGLKEIQVGDSDSVRICVYSKLSLILNSQIGCALCVRYPSPDLAV